MKLDFQRNIDKTAGSLGKDCAMFKETVDECVEELVFLEKALESRGVFELKRRLKEFRAIFNENFQIPCDFLGNKTLVELVCDGEARLLRVSKLLREK